ncbi:MAG: FtsL-like putative cell division protein [Ginsengibacter sp.]
MVEEEHEIKRGKKSKKEGNGKKIKKKLLNNKWIVVNIPFYLFVAALAILYIANGHYADKTIRSINSTARHLKEMEYEFKTVKRDVIFRSKESELAKAVEPLGLKDLLIPPVRLIDTLQSE